MKRKSIQPEQEEIAIHSGSTIQSKLSMGAPNDQYEQEADQVADRVMRMPEGEETEELQQPLVPQILSPFKFDQNLCNILN